MVVINWKSLVIRESILIMKLKAQPENSGIIGEIVGVQRGLQKNIKRIGLAR